MLLKTTTAVQAVGHLHRWWLHKKDLEGETCVRVQGERMHVLCLIRQERLRMRDIQKCLIDLLTAGM